MKHIKKKILILLGLVLFMSSISVIGQNKNEKSAQEIFPDTPENRTLVQEAYEQFLDINKKHGHFIEVNGVNMFYLEWGDSSGTPLIWSHGYSSSGFELAAVAKELVEAGYHVYSITYRGHGQTQVDDYNFSLAHIADDIAAMMDQLGIKKAVIGGLSLGGGVSTTFYENYPQRALGLILEDGGGDAVQIRTEIMYPETKEMMKNWPELQTTFKDRFSAYKYIVSWYLPGWGGEFPKDTKPMFHSMILPNTKGGYKLHWEDAKLLGGQKLRIDPAQNHNLPLLGQSWRRVNPIITYRNLSVPMLIIDPTGDSFNMSEDFEKLRAMHPGLIKVVEYPDTPHAAHPLRPNWFVRDATELLGRIKVQNYN